jgi:glycerophosphoryl diester phosphodiesterase
VRADSEGPLGPFPTSSPAADSGLRPSADGVITVAHRAGNDRAALERALSAGVDAVEADLRWDGGRIVTRHARRLPFLPVYWDRWYLRVDRRPRLTLDELLERIRGRARPYLDLKATHRSFLGALLETLRHHDAVDQAEISSGDWGQLEELRRSEPRLRLLRTVGDERQRAAYLALPPDDPLRAGIAIRRALLDAELASDARARGAPIYVWEVTNLEAARQVIAWGATGVIADSLELLHALK